MQAEGVAPESMVHGMFTKKDLDGRSSFWTVATKALADALNVAGQIEGVSYSRGLRRAKIESSMRFPEKNHLPIFL